MRDTETAHLPSGSPNGTFGAVYPHTNDAPSSIVRMIDMGIPPFLVSFIGGSRDGPEVGKKTLSSLQGALRIALGRC